MFQVQMQLIPGMDVAWVAKLKPEDPLHEYDNEDDANDKCDELQKNDKTGRKYRVFKIS